MSVEAINVMHVHAEPNHADQLGIELESIIDKLGQIEECMDYLVVRCRWNTNTWVVSSHWRTRAAMERHFQHSDLSLFIELLSSGRVRRIQISSFLNQHAICT